MSTASGPVLVVGPLPPARTGVAAYLADQLPHLARRLPVAAVAPDPAAVDAGRLAPVPLVGPAALGAADATVVYHLGNSLDGLWALRTAETGPPGVVVLHDGSLHHLVEQFTLGADRVPAYADALALAHGPAGRRLAELRTAGCRGGIDTALFDLLAPVLARHHRIVVHSRHLAGVVTDRIGGGADVVVVPHPAPRPGPQPPRSAVGVPEGAPLVGMFGFVTEAKRPRLVLEAMRHLRRRHPGAHLLVAGEDLTGNRLGPWIDRADVRDAVTVTGYLPGDRLSGVHGLVDVAVALRSPHLGESSGPLAAVFAAGVASVVQRVGSWAELPEGTVADLPVGGDEAAALADVIGDLLDDPARRAAVGAAARRYATTELDAGRCADRMAAALADLPPPPALRAVPTWWGEAVPDPVRRGTSAVVVGDRAAADGLRSAGWPVTGLAGPDGLDDAAPAAAGLAVWRLGADDVTPTRLGALNRVVTAPGAAVLVTDRAEREAASALAGAGFGPVVRVAGPDGGVALVAPKRGLPAW